MLQYRSRDFRVSKKGGTNERFLGELEAVDASARAVNSADSKTICALQGPPGLAASTWNVTTSSLPELTVIGLSFVSPATSR